jgi:hypothetical protein
MLADAGTAGSTAFAAKLGLGLALVDSRSGLGPSMRLLARRIARSFPKKGQKAGIGPRQLLLAMLGGTREPIAVRIRPSQLMLKQEWLRGFQVKLYEGGWRAAGWALDETAQVFRTELEKPQPSIAKVLAAVDAVEARRKGGGLSFTVSPSNWTVPEAKLYLSGPDVELRDPLRYFLAEAFSPDRLPGLLSLLVEAMPWATDELTSKAFGAALIADAPKALLLPLEMVDRLGSLQDLVAKVMATAPVMSRHLDAIASAYGRLQGAVDSTFQRWITAPS